MDGQKCEAGHKNLYNASNIPIIDDMPRSRIYKDKTIKTQNHISIKGTIYFKRIFFDECVELARYDFQAKTWIILCFPKEGMTVKPPS